MEVQIGKIYRHFKGNHYYVKDIALSSETLEKQVVYQALYGDLTTYVRPYNMFLEEISKNREDNITNQKYRFELINFNDKK